MFHKLRDKMKIVVLIVIIAMVGGGLWAALSYFFSGTSGVSTEAAAVVATVNGQPIHLYDLHRAFLNQLQQIEAQQGTVPGRSYEAVRYQALDLLVGSLVLNQEMRSAISALLPLRLTLNFSALLTCFPAKRTISHSCRRQD